MTKADDAKAIRSFVDYLMEAENAPLWKGDDSAAVHDSPEGGTQTVGFGHKLTEEEAKARRAAGMSLDELNREKSEELLRQDLPRYVARLKKKLGEETWKELPQRSKEMLLDIEYNVKRGIDEFPNFTEAVLTRNITGQRKEYERFYTDPEGNKKPIKERNRLFKERYLTPEALKQWGTAP